MSVNPLTQSLARYMQETLAQGRHVDPVTGKVTLLTSEHVERLQHFVDILQLGEPTDEEAQ